MKPRYIRYGEGQWFSIPLRTGGYALGIIVRGSYKTKGGLGYFFGPIYGEIPGDGATWEKNPEEAILITRFGDLGIINGHWPLIQSTRPFSKENWPIPKFGLRVSLLPGKGFLREYGQNDKGELILIRETLVNEDCIINLPGDVIMGGGSVESKLTNLLSG